MADSPRKITVISSSRADYAHLIWPLRAMQNEPQLDPELILFGAHLSPEFGRTGIAARQAGFQVRAELECLLSSDTDTGMAKTIGLATLSLADELSHDRPDMLLLIADRYEMLAAASVALALRLPMAHIEGGEVSAGAIDDAVRNALTKMAHLHLTPHQQASARVIAMGEEPWRVTTVGAPSLDALNHTPLLSAAQLAATLSLPTQALSVAPLVVAWHPLTLAADTNCETEALFAALDQFMPSFQGPLVFCFPNADAGSRHIIERAGRWCERHASARLYTNLAPLEYFSLLSRAGAIVGNSSSGIMESASFKLPCVNIGRRQQGRLMAANVIDVEPNQPQILAAMDRALSEPFAAGLKELENPYGQGTAGTAIAKVLAAAPSSDILLNKVPTPV